MHVFFVMCVIFRYQEILTDPSYAGQFVLMTNPHIGNTGINFGLYLIYLVSNGLKFLCLKTIL